MIHKNNVKSGLIYSGDSLLDIFISENKIVTPTDMSSFVLRWESEISTRNFNTISNPLTQRMSIETDSQGVKAYMFRKGLYPELTSWKLFDKVTTGRAVLRLGDYFTKSNFSIQMTCTFEEIGNWFSIMGMAYAGNPVGLMLGQSDGGLIGWGFFPVTVGSLQNQHVRVRINPSLIGTNKFNWAFTYAEKYHWQSGLTEGRMYLYINGVEQGSAIMPVGWSFASAVNDSVTGLSLGYTYVGGNRHMKGNVYSVLTYNKALTQEEVMNNYLVDKNKYLIG